MAGSGLLLPSEVNPINREAIRLNCYLPRDETFSCFSQMHTIPQTACQVKFGPDP